jgi:hypothetical protein
MYEWTKPKMAIPVHGEIIHMQEHARLAQSCGVKITFVPRNGDLIELAPQQLVLDRKVPAGRLYVDGHIIDDAIGGATSERIRLQGAGVIVLHFVLNGQGALLSPPAVVLQGIPYLADQKDQKNEDYIASLVTQYFLEVEERDRLRDDRVREHVRMSLRRVLQQVWGKKPLVEIGFSRIHSMRGDSRILAPVRTANASYRGQGYQGVRGRDRDSDSGDRRQGGGAPKPSFRETNGSYGGPPPRYQSSRPQTPRRPVEQAGGAVTSTTSVAYAPSHPPRGEGGGRLPVVSSTPVEGSESAADAAKRRRRRRGGGRGYRPEGGTGGGSTGGSDAGTP